MENTGVWMMELDRFGYTLRVMGRTKEEAEDAMREEYIRAYAKANSMDESELRAALARPVLDESGELSEIESVKRFVFDIFAALNDAYTSFYEFGKVEWE